MCMFALTVSSVEAKNIKEALADSAWIDAMQDELLSLTDYKVVGTVDNHLASMINKAKWRFMLALPEGFVIQFYPEKVLPYEEALCGLKQALRAGFDELSTS
ncbi:hypothetical protein Tco_0833811 [Tanacetum coccineum]